MKMDNSDSITIRVGESDPGKQPAEPRNGTPEIVDLAEDVVAAAASDRTVMDLVPIAKEMWNFTNCQPNPVIATSYAQLPLPIHHVISKTCVYRFQKRKALPNETCESTTPKAQLYLDLLQSHRQHLSSDPTKLVSLKCAYCARQPNHISGSCSFIRIGSPRLLADALHQRLLHLRDHCELARMEVGEQVLNTVFNTQYNRNDPHLQLFVQSWLEELETTGNQQQTASVLDDRARATTKSVQTATFLAFVQPPAVPRLPALENHLMLHSFRQQPQYVYPTAANQMQHELFLQERQRMQQQQQQQQNERARQQRLLQERVQIAQLAEEIRKRQEMETQRQQQQNQQQQQQERLYRMQKQLQVLEQELELQPQQSQQHLKPPPSQQQQKPKQQQPKKSRSKKIPFEDLRKVYEDSWEEMTQSIFQCPDDLDDENDAPEEYFRALHDKKSFESDGVQIVPNPNSKPTSLPHVQTNPDYYVPISSRKLARLEKLPYRIDEATIPKHPVPIDLEQQQLVEIGTHDVVMPCDDCPLHLAKALHDLSGNRHFFRLVSDQRSAYASASLAQKVSIVDTIFQIIRKKRGSFLKATVTIAKKRPRTWTTTDQQAEEYTRFRLQYGFPDILMQSPERQNETDKLHSNVFNVEHAPRVGLMDGYLVWNNENPSKNPKIKLSDMRRIDEPAATSTNHKASAPKGNVHNNNTEQTKDANESDIEIALEEASAKRNCPDSTPDNGSQSTKRSRSESNSSSNVE